MSAISDRYGRGGRRCIPETSAGQTRVAAHPSGDDWPTDNAVEELGKARRNWPNYWARLCVRQKSCDSAARALTLDKVQY